MKVLIGLLFSIIVLNFSAQNLVATSVNSQWPDTVAVNTTVSFGIEISNPSSVNFIDSLGILFQADSGVGAMIVDTFSLGSVSIDSLSSEFFSLTHEFSSTNYSPGNNVVVIWPIYGGVLGDSIILETFIEYSVGLAETAVKPISIYPNPVSSFFKVEGQIQFSYVINDLSGRLLITDFSNYGTIDTGNLPKGIYLLSISKNGLKSKTIRFIKH